MSSATLGAGSWRARNDSGRLRGAAVSPMVKLAAAAPPAVRVVRVARILFDATDHPLALEEVVLPLERFPGLSPNGGGDVPDTIELAQRHGIPLGRAMAKDQHRAGHQGCRGASRHCSRRGRDEAGSHCRDCRWGANRMARRLQSRGDYEYLIVRLRREKRRPGETALPSPGPWSREELPIGLQIVGPWHGEPRRCPAREAPALGRPPADSGSQLTKTLHHHDR